MNKILLKLVKNNFYPQNVCRRTTIVL